MNPTDNSGDQPEMLLQLGKTQVERGQLTAAQQTFQRCVDLCAPGPWRCEGTYLLAQLLKQQKDYAGFVQLMRTLLAAEWAGAPKVQLLRELAEVQVLQGRLEEAVETLERSLMHTSDRTIAKAVLFEEMLIYSKMMSLGSTDQRVVKYANLLQLSFGFAHHASGPIRTESMFMLGQHFLRDNKPVIALICYHLALDNDASNPLLWFTVGSVFEILKNYQEATNCYQQSLRLSPHSPDAWNALGNVAAKSNQKETALACFQQSYSLRPSDAIARKIEILLQQPAHKPEGPKEKEAKQEAPAGGDICFTTRPTKRARTGPSDQEAETVEVNADSGTLGEAEKKTPPQPSLEPARPLMARLPSARMMAHTVEESPRDSPPACTTSSDDEEEVLSVVDEVTQAPAPNPTPTPEKLKKGPKRSSAFVAPPLPVPIVQVSGDLRGIEVDQRLRNEEAFCFEKPVTLIKGLMEAIGFDMDLFSSEYLSRHFGEMEVDIRTQQQQPADVNFSGNHELWRCTSSFKKSTVKEYASYQGTFLAENDPAKRKDLTQRIKVDFCTNVDLTDQHLWQRQYDELKKLPVFLQVNSPEDMLHQYNEVILGMNRAQMYLKVPGCRTPGHQENNNFCSVNINLGPGDCEWFAVEPQYWRQMDALCRKNKVDFLKGSWWPSLKDLTKNNIPYIRFTQEVGDVVYLNSGTVHWVQALDVCNNVAWNVGPLTALQFNQAIERYTANIKEQYKSIVPMETLAWKFASVNSKDPEFAPAVLGYLRQSLASQQALETRIHDQNLRVFKYPAEGLAYYCLSCHRETFCFVFVQDKMVGEQPTLCEGCAAKLTKAGKPVVVFQCHQISKLEATLKEFEEKVTGKGE